MQIDWISILLTWYFFLDNGLGIEAKAYGHVIPCSFGDMRAG